MHTPRLTVSYKIKDVQNIQKTSNKTRVYIASHSTCTTKCIFAYEQMLSFTYLSHMSCRDHNYNSVSPSYKHDDNLLKEKKDKMCPQIQGNRKGRLVSFVI